MSGREIVFNVMLLLSCAVMTLGIIGILRMPDIYSKLHGSSKAVFLGVVTLCIASTILASTAMNMRLILIAIVVVLTTPISTHAIGRAAWLLHEQMQTPGAVDESRTLTPEPEEPIWRL